MIGVSTSAAGVDDLALPTCLQLQLLVKSLAFDRQIERHKSETVNVGVFYQSRLPESQIFFDEINECVANNQMTIGGKSLSISPIDLSFTSFESKTDQRTNVILLGPLRAFDFQLLYAFSSRYGALTVTGVPDFVGQGTAVFFAQRDGRPEIVVDLVKARAEGADFSSDFLKLVTIVRR